MGRMGSFQFSAQKKKSRISQTYTLKVTLTFLKKVREERN